MRTTISSNRLLESDPFLLNGVNKEKDVTSWRYLHGRGDILAKVRRRSSNEIYATGHVHVLFTVRWEVLEALGTICEGDILNQP